MDVGVIRKELSGIRDHVIHLLDQLENVAPQEPPNRDSHLQIKSGMQTVQAVKPVPTCTKEFDPNVPPRQTGSCNRYPCAVVKDILILVILYLFFFNFYAGCQPVPLLPPLTITFKV